MADVAEHLRTSRFDVDLAASHAQGLHQFASVFKRVRARCEPRHGVGQDVRARQFHPIHGLGGDDEGLG